MLLLDDYSLYRKYNAFSNRGSAQTEQKYRTMTLIYRASRPCILLLTMVKVAHMVYIRLFLNVACEWWRSNCHWQVFKPIISFGALEISVFEFLVWSHHLLHWLWSFPPAGGYVFTSVCLFVCLSVARISQKVLDRFSCKFVKGLAIDRGPNQYILLENWPRIFA